MFLSPSIFPAELYMGLADLIDQTKYGGLSIHSVPHTQSALPRDFEKTEWGLIHVLPESGGTCYTGSRKLSITLK